MTMKELKKLIEIEIDGYKDLAKTAALRMEEFNSDYFRGMKDAYETVVKIHKDYLEILDKENR